MISTRIAALTMALAATTAQAGAASFQDVWTATQQGPYDSLPQYQTSYSKFFASGIDLLTKAVDRTLSDDADVLPRFQKLVHPIGICFAGTWKVTAENGYTGAFAQGSEHPIIVRASEALGRPDAGGNRSFGLAGKIFAHGRTANFFTIDDLGGTSAASFLDEHKTNEPKTSVHFDQFAWIPTLTKIAKTFTAADSNVGIRQLYQVSGLGLASPEAAATPQWMALVSENAERNGASDFRDELRLANFDGGLRFGIYTADVGDGAFQRLGTVTLVQEALSDGCDHVLHFQHPRSK